MISHILLKLGITLFSICALQFVSSVCLAEGINISRVKMLVDTCVTCHGPKARGSKNIPKLKGLDVQDIMESMKGFQTGEEKSTIMGRYAKAYTELEIKLLAQYLAAIE